MFLPNDGLERRVRNLRVLEDREGGAHSGRPPRGHLHVGPQIGLKRARQDLPGGPLRNLVQEELGQLALVNLRGKGTASAGFLDAVTLKVLTLVEAA